jgi:hypothetical protein
VLRGDAPRTAPTTAQQQQKQQQQQQQQWEAPSSTASSGAPLPNSASSSFSSSSLSSSSISCSSLNSSSSASLPPQSRKLVAQGDVGTGRLQPQTSAPPAASSQPPAHARQGGWTQHIMRLYRPDAYGAHQEAAWSWQPFKMVCVPARVLASLQCCAYLALWLRGVCWGCLCCGSDSAWWVSWPCALAPLTVPSL